MLEGWSTDSCKNFFGQMITSVARALQNLFKMQILDLPRSTLKLRVGQNLIPSLVHSRLKYAGWEVVLKYSYLKICCKKTSSKAILARLSNRLIFVL